MQCAVTQAKTKLPLLTPFGLLVLCFEDHGTTGLVFGLRIPPFLWKNSIYANLALEGPQNGLHYSRIFTIREFAIDELAKY